MRDRAAKRRSGGARGVHMDELPVLRDIGERVDQRLIDQEPARDELTQDRQFIHVDPARAAATSFGGTVAHGFLTLSLLSAMADDALPERAHCVGVNYGFDRVRFVAPVTAGSRLRGRFSVIERSPRGVNETQTRLAVSVEIEGGTKPALVAEWLTLSFPRSGE